MRQQRTLWTLVVALVLSKGATFTLGSRSLAFRTALKATSEPAPEGAGNTVSLEDGLGVNGYAVLKGETVDITMSPHRPLGCTVEESLAGGHHVFVAKLKQGSYAADAGIQVGDVIVGVSGIFGEMEDVMGRGIDKVRGLVSARPDEESLQLEILRGTSVLQDHEEALVKLCSDPDADDEQVENCVVDFLTGGYVQLDQADDDDNSAEEECNIEDDDCLVGDLYNMWAEDLPGQMQSAPEMPTTENNNEEEDKPKPWSSRASSSGTFVRDPVSGEMRNIDA